MHRLSKVVLLPLRSVSANRILIIAFACTLAAIVGWVAACDATILISALLVIGAIGLMLSIPELALGIFLVTMSVWTFLPPDLYSLLHGYSYPLTVGLACSSLLARYGLRKITIDKIGFALLTFSAYLFLSVVWTTAPAYGLLKAQTFFLSSTVLYFLVWWVYSKNPQTLWRLVTVAALLGLIPFAVTVIAGINVGFGIATRAARVYYIATETGFETYGISNGLLVSAVCSAALWLEWGRSKHRRFWLLLVILYFWALLSLSQRAQIIASGLAVGILFATQGSLQELAKTRLRVNFRRLFLVLLLVGLVSLIGSAKFRPAFLLEDENITTRFHLQKWAWAGFVRSPVWGGGLGSFSMSAFGVDARIFSHNMILDVLAEGGLIGLFLFGYLLYQVGRYSGRLCRSSNAMTRLGVLGMVMFIARSITALFSADLSSWAVGPWLAMITIATGNTVGDPNAPVTWADITGGS